MQRDPSERGMREALRHHATLAPVVATDDCLDDGTIAALADGADAEQRARSLPHLARCPRCRRAVASVALAIADPVVIAARPAGRIRVRRLAWALLPLAAALALLLRPSPPPDAREGTHRSAPRTDADAPAPVAPLGIVAEGQVLRWSGVGGASRYRVSLFDATGALRFETQLADTALALPDSIGLVTGVRYLWKVEALVGFDRWSASPLAEFTIAPAPRP